MLFQKGGGTIDLEPRLSHTSAVEPTLAPVVVERLPQFSFDFHLSFPILS
jgi:hypothetical protein